MIVAARVLGPEQIGIYAFCVVFIGIFHIIVNLGFEPYIQREVGRDSAIASSLMTQVFIMKFAVYLLSVVIIVITAHIIIPSEYKRNVLYIITVTMFFQTYLAVANAFFRAFQKTIYEGASRIILRIINTGAGLAALAAGKGLMALVIIELIAQMLACMWAWLMLCSKLALPRLQFEPRELIRLVGKTWHFSIIRIVQSIFNSIDMIMLSTMIGDLFTGYYSAAVRITSSAFGFIPNSFTGAFLPPLSRKALEDTDSFMKAFTLYFKYLVLAGITIAVFMAGFTHDIVVLCLGKEFIPIIVTVKIMAAVIFITFVNWPLTTALIALDCEREVLRIFTVSAVVNILLNIVLLPLWKDRGAASTTLFSQILLLFLQSIVLFKQGISVPLLFRRSTGPLLTGIITFTMAYFLESLGPQLWIRVSIVSVLFFVMLLVSGSFYKELSVLRKVVGL